jgi:hypothetical protein
MNSPDVVAIDRDTRHVVSRRAVRDVFDTDSGPGRFRVAIILGEEDDGSRQTPRGSSFRESAEAPSPKKQIVT